LKRGLGWSLKRDSWSSGQPTPKSLGAVFVYSYHVVTGKILEDRTMPGIAVSLLTEDQERLSVLQSRLESVQAGQIVYSHLGFPTGPSDPVLRQIQDVHTDVVLVDIDPKAEHRSLTTIELIRSSTEDIAVFAMGEMVHPATIVACMRAGASEYLERNAPAEVISTGSPVLPPRAASPAPLPAGRGFSAWPTPKAEPAPPPLP